MRAQYNQTYSARSQLKWPLFLCSFRLTRSNSLLNLRYGYAHKSYMNHKLNEEVFPIERSLLSSWVRNDYHTHHKVDGYPVYCPSDQRILEQQGPSQARDEIHRSSDNGNQKVEAESQRGCSTSKFECTLSEHTRRNKLKCRSKWYTALAQQECCSGNIQYASHDPRNEQRQQWAIYFHWYR